MQSESMDAYFQGEKLYGDDFNLEQLQQWYADEAEGYAGLGAAEKGTGTYGYHELNKYHGWSHIQLPAGARALGLGAAYGEEFLPVVEQLGAITILEPSKQLRTESLKGVPLTYVDPEISGVINCESDQFDLATSFGVLHHVANVSTVVKELARVLKPGGYALIREPIDSMGDWRQPRHGLTKRERGIPWPILRKICTDAGFEIVRESPCFFILCFRWIKALAAKQPEASYWNDASNVRRDALLAKLTAGNYTYHRPTGLKRLRPTNVYYVLRKR